MSDCSIMARSNRFIHRPNIRSQSLPKTHKQLGNREESIYNLAIRSRIIGYSHIAKWNKCAKLAQTVTLNTKYGDYGAYCQKLLHRTSIAR